MNFSWQEFKEKTRRALLSKRSKDLGVFLLFFVIASVFWLIQTDNTMEKEFSIPVKLKNTPDNVVFTSEPAKEVRVRIKDRTSVMINYWLNKSFYPIEVKVPDFLGKDAVAVPLAYFQQQVRRQIKSSTTIVAIKPDTFEIYYSKGAYMRFPVKLSGTLKTARQYYITRTFFSPDTVAVYAPQDILDTMTAAYTTKRDVANLSDTSRISIPLKPIKGVKYIPANVNLNVLTDMYTEKTLEIPLQGVNFPPGKAFRAFPSKVKVIFTVGLSDYQKYDAGDFHILVSYEELLNAESDKYTVKINNLPEGISQVRFVPAQVDFLIEQVGEADGKN